jgi:hypothetical protein
MLPFKGVTHNTHNSTRSLFTYQIGVVWRGLQYFFRIKSFSSAVNVKCVWACQGMRHTAEHIQLKNCVEGWNHGGANRTTRPPWTDPACDRIVNRLASTFVNLDMWHTPTPSMLIFLRVLFDKPWFHPVVWTKSLQWEDKCKLQTTKSDAILMRPNHVTSCVGRKWFRPTWPRRPSPRWGSCSWRPSWARAHLVTEVRDHTHVCACF